MVDAIRDMEHLKNYGVATPEGLLLKDIAISLRQMNLRAEAQSEPKPLREAEMYTSPIGGKQEPPQIPQQRQEPPGKKRRKR